MIRYIKYQDIDKSKWDHCISNAPNGLLFAYSWYLDAVCDKWNALVYKDYEAVMPVTVKNKLSVQYFFNPIFAPQLGVFSVNEVSDELLTEMISAIPSSIKMIDIGLNPGNKVLELGSYKISEKKCQYIDLNTDYNLIRSNYSTNLTRSIKKAEKNNVVIKTSSDIHTVFDIFKANKGSKLAEYNFKTFRYLEKLLSSIIKHNCGITYNAYSENQLLASACFGWSNNRIIYIKGGSTEWGRNVGAMHLIMDTVIKEHSNTQNIFDFGGSNIPDVARFNKNFGADDYLYFCLKKNSLPLYIKWLKK